VGELIRTWWPVLLLVWLPGAIQTVMSAIITRAFRRLDESHPDDLPLTAGEWLQREIHRLGLGGRLSHIVTDAAGMASLDAYHPEHGVIQLTADTHFKRDPMHWAIAAHELGHARFKVALPVFGRFIVAMVYVKRGLVAVALALVFGNALFALPHVTDLALHLFQAALALQLLVLLDESIASTLALRSLRASPEVRPSHMRSARTVLALAFSTYAIGFATRAAMLTQWHHVVDHTKVPAVPPLYHPTTLGMVLAGIATVMATLYALNRIYLAFRRDGTVPKREAAHSFMFQCALLLFVYLVWNHRADVQWARYVMAAIVPISGWFIAVLSLPGAIFDLVLFDRIAKKFVVDPTDRTKELRRDHEAGKDQRYAGNVAFTKLIERSDAVPRFERRVRELCRLCYVPLVIAFWLS
jgi:Zn-dependent membrane protease YugP